MGDPYAAWARLISAGFEFAQTNARAAETIWAAGSVIAARTAMMAGGCAGRPAERDELARMVPEKVRAFSSSATAVWQHWTQNQSAFLDEAQHWSRVALDGPPSLTAMAAHYARPSAFALTWLEAQARLGATALAPVHRAATRNARRLAR